MLLITGLSFLFTGGMMLWSSFSGKMHARDHLLDGLGLTGDETVLDVGCGAQPYRGLLNPSVKYIGIDTTDATHFGYRVPDTIYIDAEDDWPVADGSVDAVMSTETLEHVPDPASFLRKTSRAC